jgi:hypothetical protein
MRRSYQKFSIYRHRKYSLHSKFFSRLETDLFSSASGDRYRDFVASNFPFLPLSNSGLLLLANFVIIETISQSQMKAKIKE